MRVCVYGAGGVGAYLAAALHDGRCDVAVVDRGAHLQALRERGLTLRNEEAERHYRIPAFAPGDEHGGYDYLLVAVKTWSLEEALGDIARLLDADTAVASLHNGIPWWYFHGLRETPARTQLESVDPGARQWTTFGAARALGCVFYPACEVLAPGVVRHSSGNRVALGEPSGEKSARVVRLAEALRAGGVKAVVKPDIRNEVWLKLIGNLAFNPLSVLTGCTLAELGTAAATRDRAMQMMREAQAVGRALGADFRLDLQQRIDGAAAVGAHKTSMLQDYERGLPLELGAIVESVQELGRITGCATPAIDGVLAEVRSVDAARLKAPA